MSSYLFVNDSSTANSIFAPTNTVEGKLTPEKCAEALKINTWKAEKRPNFTEVKTRIPDGNHLVKISDGADYSAVYPKIINRDVPDSYAVIQYSEGLQWLDYFIAEELVELDSGLIIDDTEFAVTVRLP